jgi:hypothetical protein
MDPSVLIPLTGENLLEDDFNSYVLLGKGNGGTGGRRTPLQPGEQPIPPGVKVADYRNMPAFLPGKWKVQIVAVPGHVYIRYENCDNPDLVYTAGKYNDGYGGRWDEERNEWIIPPVLVPGVQWEQDKSKEDGFKKGMYPYRETEVENPKVYMGGTANKYELTHNNCTTYACAAWEFYTGERLRKGWVWHDPDTVMKHIKELNSEKGNFVKALERASAHLSSTIDRYDDY